MRLGVFGDVHANLEALTAVLDDAATSGVTHYACIGDVVGYGANPRECLEIVRALGCPVVKGNHDCDVSSTGDLQKMNPVATEALEWTRTQLTKAELHWLHELPLVDTIDPQTTIVHATLLDPSGWQYVFDGIDAFASMRRQTTKVCFHGHTHKPRHFVSVEKSFPRVVESDDIPVDDRKNHFINVGSVGQPRDGDPRACYAVFDQDSNTVLRRRVSYDISIAQEKIREAGLPEMLAKRLAIGK